MRLAARLKIRDMCLFNVKIYVEAWYATPKTVEVPNHDLNFMKKLMKYKHINKSISQAAAENI